MVVVVVGGECGSKRQTDDRRCRGENLRHSESSLTMRLAHKAYVNLNVPFGPAMREIVIDTETAGLDPLSGDRIVEIGAVELVNHSHLRPFGNSLASPSAAATAPRDQRGLN